MEFSLSDARSDVTLAAQRLFIERACDFALSVDPDGRVNHVNAGVPRLLAMLADDLLGRELLSLVSADCRPALRAALKAADAGRAEARDLDLVSSIGSPVPIRAKVFRDPATDQVWVVGYDLSEMRKVERDLRTVAAHDPLTGLPNKSLLHDRIERHIALAKRQKGCFAVLMMDLDGFKKVNDALGHLAGDTLLKVVGTRVRDTLRDVDTISRTGGDEFVLVLDGVQDHAVVQQVCERVLEAVRKPIVVQGQEVYVSASIGVACYPEQGNTVLELIQHADMAMYRAKQLGKNRFSHFEQELVSASSAQVSIEASMHAAVRSGEFLVQYQPLVDAAGTVRGCEALMRWRKPDGSFVPPAEFIPVAENNGLITLLGDYVLRAAAMQLKRFDEAGIGGLYMSVNVSPRQLRHPDFEKNLRKVLSVTGIEPGRLVLEITETMLMNDQGKTQALLRQISSLGVRCAIDDFGTGYSCLAYLKSYPISALKVDRSFTQDVEHDDVSRYLVKAVIDLAQALGLETVAEGVETEGQARLLAQMGVDHLQGYLYGRPVDPLQFIEKFRCGRVPAASGSRTS
ncbi:putative bifunctional diguanylate cyclase/phosphodiesterase [Caldimonas tepidiphila]|uniref:putative bifunctional diguanylate cyclase/phosphodiesterase n=1 Tax=Caldimonas tepidiphila TaxID=2315841 RepID=UPI000E5B1A29|nr:EAL domain-containing protein [Caldimonas tepidiphila]